MTNVHDANKPNAVFIGPEKIMDVIAREKPEWEFIHVNTPQEFQMKLETGEISNYFQIIFIIDHFFDPTGENILFEQTIAYFSPYCLVNVLSYHPEYQDSIRNRFEEESYQIGTDAGDIYFIPKRGGVLNSVDNAVAKFTRNPTETNRGAVDTLLGYTNPSILQQEDASGGSIAPPEKMRDNPYLGQVVAVTSSKGGSGKSTVAISLATYLAKASREAVKKGESDRELKVIILDLDIRDGQVGFFTGVVKPTVLQIRTKGVSEESIKETRQHVKRLGLDVILAPRRARSADDLPPDFFVDLIQKLKTMYDYVFLDTSVNYTDPLLEKVAYPIADQILMVTELVAPSVFSMARWIQEVTEPRSRQGMGISKKKIGIIVNKAISDVGMDGSSLKQNTQGLQILTAIPSNQRLIAHATNSNSMDVILEESHIRQAYKRLALMVVGKKHPLADLPE